MLICCVVQFDGYFVLGAGLFAIAGAIESLATKIPDFKVIDKEIEEE